MTEDDDQLIERLRAIALQVDPPPEFVAQAAEAALLTRRMDSALAALINDSAAQAQAPELVRGEGEQIRMLSFEWNEATIELEIHAVGRTVALRGLVTGASGDDVTVETGNEQRTASIDEEGWFTVDGLEPGLLRMHLRVGDTTVTTSWVTF